MLEFLRKIHRKYNLYYFRKKPLLWIYSAYLTLRFIDKYSGFPAIRFTSYMPVKIVKRKGAKLNLLGTLLFEPWLRGKHRTSIVLHDYAELNIERDFLLGDNIRIFIAPKGKLILKGKENESASGVTANSVIMVNKSLTIGKDCIIAWDTFLTDCDWHSIVGKVSVAETILGNNVWIGVGAKVLKGAKIGNNSIVTSNSVVLQGSYEERAMISGNPAKVIKSGIADWNRDLRND